MASWHGAAPLPQQPKIEAQSAPAPPATNAAKPPPGNAPSPAPTNAPSPPAVNKVEAAKEAAAAPSLKRPKTQHKVAAASDGDLPPGVDGGSTDAEVPFFFRRQPVFYRSAHPVGSIIIDKQQHFLYLIRPNQVALRYGIGVGKSCAGVAGLHKVAGKKEWPEWQPPADMIERKLAPAGVMKGEPGNPLGARIIVLDDGSLNIHGTNAPKNDRQLRRFRLHPAGERRRRRSLQSRRGRRARRRFRLGLLEVAALTARTIAKKVTGCMRAVCGKAVPLRA